MGGVAPGRSEAPTILLSAGETSGDLYAARLATLLRQRLGARVRGLAGPRMRAAGVEAVARTEDVSVLGVTEIVRHLPKILGAARRLERVLQEAPCLAILVDYPGFHLRLAARARRLGVPVLYYIGPQVWAWWKGRLARMARLVDHAAVVFPFEVPLYAEAGIPVTYVGHPLAEELRVERTAEAVRGEAGLSPDAPYLALLPGSREQEVRQLLPAQLEAWRLLSRDDPGLGGIVAAASDEMAERCREIARRAGVRVPILVGATHSVAAHARAAVVASGTASLETAILGTPLVIVYRVSRLTWEVGRRVVRVTRLGLPNLLAGEDVAPELLQDDARPERIAAAVRPLLRDGPQRQAALVRLAGLRSRLGEPGTAGRVAEIAARLCRQGRRVAPRSAESA